MTHKTPRDPLHTANDGEDALTNLKHEEDGNSESSMNGHLLRAASRSLLLRRAPARVPRRGLCALGRGGVPGSSEGGVGGGGGGGGGGSDGGGGGGSNKSCNCPRCQGSLTKFWSQDAPVWGCVDCKEIYSNGNSARPRSWSGTPMLPDGTASSSAAAASAASPVEPGRFSPGSLPSPAVLKSHLDRYVIGQDDVKRVLSVALYNHYKRLRISSSNAPTEGAEGRSIWGETGGEGATWGLLPKDPTHS